VFLAFGVGVLGGKLLGTQLSDELVLDRQMFGLLLGGMLAVGIGVYDDFRQLGPKVKFAAQIAGASIAFFFGVKVCVCDLFPWTWMGELVSYGVTVFWFLLLINAINLIDGVDGLSGGICFFASTVMALLSVMKQDYVLGVFFTSMAGAILGFLRYNFNPATIFLGDGGSYFLGYAIAGLSTLGAVKGQVSSVLLIPVVALGVPLMDTILAPIRRWLRGRKMFRPDKGHIHHKLMARGYTTRSVVGFLYLVTVALCLGTLILVNLQDEHAGLVLVILGAAAFFIFQKSGYLEYFAMDKVYGWFRDVYDSAGLSYERRSFLDLQIEMSKAQGVDELWKLACLAMEMLHIDYAEMFHFNGMHREGDFCLLRREEERTEDTYVWNAPDFDKEASLCRRTLFKMEMPLLTRGRVDLGSLWVVMDLEGKDPSPYLMRRVEQLRVSMVKNLKRISDSRDRETGREGGGRPETGDGKIGRLEAGDGRREAGR
jgi:UDP-GlcNAc:undecaprenyl-phosphate GlcNAc-1-phosphate transferase